MEIIGVISAAGLGRRMKSDIPKPLTVLPNGMTILDFQINKFIDHVDKLIVIINEKINNHTLFKPNNAVQYILQTDATGMGDSVFLAGEYFIGSNSLILSWVDQVGITTSTILECLNKLSSSGTEKVIVIPILEKRTAYIDLFVKDHKLLEVKQSREGDLISNHSRSDVGLFAISDTAQMLDLWKKRGREYSKGKITGEYNFLPFLSMMSQSGWEIETLKATELDGIGFNTPEEFDTYVERIWN
jgi:bifunctional N-acetylglucosamine-1-phosphate-uridyltransferase/glucosamine-1-phosphate-acetyltransferase GlmU-like protein